MWWLERARPDVLLMQETKLADADAPAEAFRDAGYELAHHGEGRWNGVAIASRCGIGDVVTNFGQPLAPAADPGRRRRRAARRGADDRGQRAAASESSACTRRTGASSARPSTRPSSPGSIASRAGSPRRRIPPSRWCSAATSTSRPKTSTSGIRAPVTAGRTSPQPEREAFAQALPLGTGRRLSPAPSRARPLHLVGLPRRQLPQELRHAHRSPAGRPARSPSARSGRRSTARRARASRFPPTTRRCVIDLDQPGQPFDAGWKSAEGRIAARRTAAR